MGPTSLVQNKKFSMSSIVVASKVSIVNEACKILLIEFWSKNPVSQIAICDGMMSIFS